MFLDIVFQSGDFYSQASDSWLFTLFNTILGAFIGSGASVFIFYKTIGYDKLKEEYKQRKFQKDKIKYFQSLIRSIDNGLSKQIPNLESYAKEIQSKPTDLPLLNSIPLFDLSRIVHKINQEEYYHAFLAEFGNNSSDVEEYRKIIQLLDYFDANFDLIKDSLKKSFDFDYERKLQYKRMIEKAMDDTAATLINQELQNEHDFLNFLNDTIVSFHENRDNHSDTKFYHDNFVQVLKAGLIQFSRHIPRAHYLLVQLKNATQFYTNIEGQNLAVASDFEKWKEDLSKRQEELKQVTKRLLDRNIIEEQQPMKKFWLF